MRGIVTSLMRKGRSAAVRWSMGYILRTVVLAAGAAIAYFWATSEVPGGEKRYQQMVRQFKDRHEGSPF